MRAGASRRITGRSLVSQTEKLSSISVNGPEFRASALVRDRIDFVLSFLRRRYLTILICLLLSLPIGALYLFTAPPTYTGSTVMMIDSRSSQIIQKSAVGDLRPDPGWIESQIGILRSQNVAAYVVKQLRLADNREFIRSNVTLFDKLLDRLGWGDPEPTTEAERTGAAIGTVMGGLDVRRVGQSYMMRIDFSSHNRELAGRVAGAMIDAYIFDQLNSKYQANRRAGDVLQERLQALREQAAAAERAVVEFKAKNNIVAASGTLMNEKQLTETSSQVAAARAHTADIVLRLERIGAVRRAYQTEKTERADDETVAEAMNNSIIMRMREKYLDLLNREADWSVRYGKYHQAVVNLRNQIRDIRRSIYDELGRIEEVWKSDYEVGKKRQAEQEQSLGSLISQSTETNQARVALFSLEASAQSYRKLYDNFLQQHTESVQQQTFPISDARLISPASVAKTAPKPLKVWLVTAFAGMMVGVGFGAFREIMDRGFRTRDQVRSVLGTECVALFPMLPDHKNRVFSRQQALALPQPAQRGASRSIYSSARIIRTIISSPSSPYADAIRSIKLTVDLNNQPNYTKIIGLTSCLPSEGKSTLAAATAALIAQSGARVLLLDCDLRHPALSRALAPDASAGFVDVVAGKIDLADAVWDDPTTNMAFLPAGADTEVPNATEILSSEAAKSLFS